MAAKTQEIASVWTRPQRPRRDTPNLSREHIVAEAIALLDEEGMTALSMRKLGARLGAGATSLYTHVANKDELIELVADQIFGELTTPDPEHPDGWRAAMLALARDLRATILRHPWLAAILGEVGLLYLGPNMMRLNEAALTVLEESGFDTDTADHALTVLFSFVLGVAVVEAATQVAVRRSGLSEQEWITKLWPAAEAASRDYPRIHKLYTRQSPTDVVSSADQLFVHRVGLILDGLAPKDQG
ncbi:TetR/AcrR family transcriptional regulator [Nocardia sp. CDC159]|uniref:TetR/AcrR family transcriptional regulator n=1 Tax=Nocardia pulmonis TaxID=2951408 RepID=A0A9X2E416_9NOCA|nr:MULTISPECIES: TetR/AcrR family transcriptional regulator [Nocardia]MCM6772683.1 TetR/AcrR family transcriptional regulator [Nocardia pulmonis]MCM6786014.1 TetR/AcrR family transcriptional regulator [Nocardia sp. CDC159]